MTSCAASSMVRISGTLALPPDVVTQSVAILAKRRAGKSYTARRVTEELLRAGEQVVIIDPKGDWWGIRSSADGRNPGFPVIIFGGEHGDLPLEKTAAETVARLIVEERVNVLLDLSEFRKGEVAEFMGGGKQVRDGLLELIYRLKAREEFRTPMMLIVDEADAIAPQKPYPGEERMLGAMEDIVRRGGQRGIGSLVVTQRSAVLNKNVLTQTQVLIAMRTIAEQDLNPIMAWVRVHSVPEQEKTLKDSLPSLPVGDAWISSPGWPTEAGIFERVHILPITTFDSGATPKAGEKPARPKTLADIDLSALQRRMAETIERAKAEDPRQLHKTIRELRQQLAQEKSRQIKPDPDALKREFDRGAESVKRQLAREWKKVEQIVSRFRARVTAAFNFGLEQAESLQLPSLPPLESVIEQVKSEPARPHALHASLAPRRAPSLPDRISDRAAASEALSLSTGERAILNACAQHGSEGCTREQLSILTGYKRSSRDTYIQRLASKGLLANSGSGLIATTEGVEALGPDFEPLPTGSALAEWWLDRLGGGERQILQILIQLRGAYASRDAISASTGYKRSSRDTYIQRLAARKLIEVSSSGVRAREDLFG